MNCEFEVKGIMRRRLSPEETSKKIRELPTNFRDEDILTALKKGGKDVSEIYRTLIKLDKKSNDK